MSEFSMFHILIILLVLTPFLASPIIWFQTKDPDNKWLKGLYWFRFTVGLISLLGVALPKVYHNLIGGVGPEQFGEILGTLFFSYLLMRRWTKKKS